MATAINKKPILPVLMVNFIGTLGNSIVIPFLVFLVDKFGGNEFIYGLMGSVYPAFQFFGAPILGKWSDTFGRRRILFLSQGRYAISMDNFYGGTTYTKNRVGGF